MANETFSTGIGEIMFMALSRPFKNKQGVEKYSIKLKLDAKDSCIDHLLKVNEKKINTITNGKLAREGITDKLIVNFESNFEVKVVDANNNELKGAEIPFFDGRIDSGKAAVTYIVRKAKEGDNHAVYLTGVKLVELNRAPREEGEKTLDVTLDTLKNIG